VRRALAAFVVISVALGFIGLAPAAPAARASGTGLRPRIVWKPIPFGERRKRQMGAYSKRHYGRRGWRLEAPAVIVEHYTDGTSFSSAWNHFAANGLHLGEKPGVCAHFIIDTDGTIYQVARLGVRCRHVIGLNHTSIGIEHVGTSDAQVLGNRRQMRRSLRLTLWLMVRFDINIGNVIGHAESLHSPHHLELYRDWRCLTHADFPHPAMREFRHRVRDLAATEGVAVGAGPRWQPSGC
jgi:N-acetylmuramoyl-L-alanine amidase-like protein